MSSTDHNRKGFFTDGKISRRNVLSMSVLAGAAIAMFPAAANASTGAVPALVSAGSLVGASVNGSLRKVASYSGIKNVYDDAFVNIDYKCAEMLRDASGKLKIAVSMVGLTNQLQIIDAQTGVLEHVESLPESYGLINEMKWDSGTSTLYLAVGGGNLMTWTFATKKANLVGQVAPGASSVMAFALDSTGRLWGGSSKAGVIWNYTPATGRLITVGGIDADSGYARSMEIKDDIAYTGTGANNPKIVSFPTANPSIKTVIRPNDAGSSGFVNPIAIRGDKMFYIAPNTTGKGVYYVYDLTGKKFIPTLGRIISGGMFSGDVDDTVIYSVTETSIYQTDTRGAMTNVVFGNTSITSVLTIMQDGDLLIISGSQAGGKRQVIEHWSISSRQLIKSPQMMTVPATLQVQSLLAVGNDIVYAGAFQGGGISSLNTRTGERGMSSESAPMGQVENMIQSETGRIYMGAYQYADICSFDTSKPISDATAYEMLIRLTTNYQQSRPFAWCNAGGKTFFGTVPEYGVLGGAIGSINTSTNKVSKVTRNIIVDQSIVSLQGYDDLVYGTSSVAGGDDIVPTKTHASFFLFDAVSETVIWQESLEGSGYDYGDLYSPIVLDGYLFATHYRGVLVIDLATRKPVRDHIINASVPRSAGWANARSVQVPGTNKIVHSASGYMTLLDLEAGTYSELNSKDVDGLLYSLIAVSPDGKVYAPYDRTKIAEISLTRNRAINSEADLVEISSSGDLHVRRSNGAGEYGAPVLVSGGWDHATIKSFHVTDWNADGVLDVMVQRTDGKLFVHHGNGRGGFDAPVLVGSSGWGTMKLAVGNWMGQSDPYPSIIAITTTGQLRHYKVNSKGGINAYIGIGSGWTSYDIAMTDFTHTGVQGLLARYMGKLYFYPSDGNGQVLLADRMEVSSSGWDQMNAITTVKGHYASSIRSGLVYRNASGVIRYISSTGTAYAGVRSVASTSYSVDSSMPNIRS
jgi:hypothetical protein